MWVLFFMPEKLFYKNTITRFFISAAALYFLWFILYNFVIKPYTLLDEKVIKNIIQLSASVLSLFNQNIYSSSANIDVQMIGIDGAHPVWIGEPCNAVTIMALFSIFIVSFPGAVKNKWWFIPSGILIIHFVNVMRVCALALIQYRAPEYLDFNHNYTFTIIVYACVFGLWMLWVNRFSKIKDGQTK